MNLSFFDGNIPVLFWPGIDLARTAEFPVGVIDAFLPLGDPSRKPADGEHDGEHVGGNSDGSQNNSTIKINVWIQIMLDKIIIV